MLKLIHRDVSLSALWIGLVLCLALVTACGPAAPPTSTPEQIVPAPTPTSEQTDAKIPTALPTESLLAPAGDIFGVEVGQISPERGLGLIVDASAAWVRRNGVLWSEVEPERGARRWEALSGLEEELIRAAEAGLKVILIVRSTPTWAQSAPGLFCGPIQADALPAFGNFLHDLVARYSQAPYNVRYWEIWNEPDIDRRFVGPESAFGCWGDEADPYYGGGRYAEALKAIYPRVKAADPRAEVLVGGLLLDCDPVDPPLDPATGQPLDCTPSRFLQGVLENEGGPFFDGVSFHAYDYYAGPDQYNNPRWHSAWNTTGPVLLAKAAYLNDLLREYGHPGKFLINTEQALLCLAEDQAACESPAFQETKARYVAQSYTAALAAGLRSNIWYSLRGWRHSELVDRTLAPYPAYHAYRIAAESLGGARYVGPVTQYPGVMGADLRRGETGLWILWSQDGRPHTITLPIVPDAARTLYGDPLVLSQVVEIEQNPVFLEWNP